MSFALLFCGCIIQKPGQFFCENFLTTVVQNMYVCQVKKSQHCVYTCKTMRVSGKYCDIPSAVSQSMHVHCVLRLTLLPVSVHLAR